MGFITDTAAAIASEVFGDGGSAATGISRSNKLIQAGEEVTVFTAQLPKATSTGEELVEEVIILEGSVKEAHMAMSKITKNPVEFGPAIADHRINEPRKFVLNATVTDYPLGEPDYDWGADLSGQTYSKAAWAKLNDVRENSYPFVLSSGLQEYNNLLITSLTCSRTSANATVLQVVIRFEEVIVVDTQTERVNSTDIGVTEQTSAEKDGGDKALGFKDAFKAGVSDDLAGRKFSVPEVE